MNFELPSNLKLSSLKFYKLQNKNEISSNEFSKKTMNVKNHFSNYLKKIETNTDDQILLL